VLGGIIPKADIDTMGPDVVQKVFTPKDYNLNVIMEDIVGIVAKANNISLKTG